jgi:cytoskeleton protein RodZ
VEATPANPVPESPAATPAPVVRSIGERLRAARERSGLSVPVAAEKLHLDPKVVEALEADRFAELGASVYVRGHLKRYADFVGEPGAELVAQYSNRDVRPAAPDLTRAPHAEHRADPRALKKPLMALGGAAALILAVWWVLSGSRAPDALPDTSQTNPLVPGDDALALDGAALQATPAALVSDTTVPSAGSPSPVTAATPAQATVPPPGDTAPARDTSLRLELGSDSWVEVYNSRGERLFYDVASAGTVHSVDGRAPLRVVLGNAAGAIVEVDGERREIPANAADGEGARFNVNRSGSLTRAR